MIWYTLGWYDINAYHHISCSIFSLCDIQDVMAYHKFRYTLNTNETGHLQTKPPAHKVRLAVIWLQQRVKIFLGINNGITTSILVYFPIILLAMKKQPHIVGLLALLIKLGRWLFRSKLPIKCQWVHSVWAHTYFSNLLSYSGSNYKLQYFCIFSLKSSRDFLSLYGSSLINKKLITVDAYIYSE